MKIPSGDLYSFLFESNAIENVRDEDSLIQATHAWKFLTSNKKMTVGTILQAHKILMLNQRSISPDQKGYFRTVPVWVGGGEQLNSALIHEQMLQWVINTNDLAEYEKENPEFLADRIKYLHIVFEKIHPFVDGNGRIGRLLLNWTRIRLGLPLLIIHEGIEQLDYYKWFK